MQRLRPMRPLGKNQLRSSLETAVTTMSNKPEFLSDCEVLDGLPIFWIAAQQSGVQLSRAIDDWFLQLTIPVIRGGQLPLYRGVSLTACERVLTNGIYVVPTDSVIWANDLKKASEYGELIMILNQAGMRRSFTMLDANAAQETRLLTEQEYGAEPTIFPDGTIWYSRLAQTDRRRGSPYEAENGWYIPGDPFSVLSGIIIHLGRGTANSRFGSTAG
jgi:hypothetical protein